MGWLSHAVKAVTGGVSNAVSHPGDTLRHLGGALANPAGNLKDWKNDPVGAEKNLFNNITDPTGTMGGALADPLGLLDSKKAPQAPGVNPDLENLRKQQQDYANQFRAGIPGLENQMVGQLKADTSRQLNQNKSQMNSYNSSRGLLYGGVNQGEQGQLRNEAQRGLLSGASKIATGLQGEADQLDQSAIKTGVNIQAQSQALQNMIYQNAAAAQAGQNAMTGDLMSAGMMAAMLA